MITSAMSPSMYYVGYTTVVLLVCSCCGEEHAGISYTPCMYSAYFLFISIKVSFTDPANITQAPIGITANQMSTIEFDCILFGNPIPFIMWGMMGPG